MQTSEQCDVLVIGGGVAGCGVFRDLSTRGIKAVLVEKGDFGSGTTSRSTRIVHGGIRYLESFEFGLVREGLRERSILLRIAPHLVKPLRFVIPVYRGASPGRLKIKFGMILYDLLSLGKTLPSHGFLSREEAKRMVPTISIEGLAGAYLYYDAQVPLVERLCVENVMSGERSGGRAYNYCEAIGLLRDGEAVRGAVVRDAEDGREREVRSRYVVNCTGPWVDGFLGVSLGRKNPLLTLTKGIHLFCTRFSEEAVVFYSSDGRLLFAIPWQGYSLVGTTDTVYSGPVEGVRSEKEDVEYLLAALGRRFPGVDPRPFSTVAGLRPLAFADSDHPSKISRGYSVVDHRQDGADGLVSVLGVKITEYRAAAEKVGSLISLRLGKRVASKTAILPLSEDAGDRVAAGPLPRSVEEHLLDVYGPRAGLAAEEIAKDGSLLSALCPHNPDIEAQVVVAVKFELARSAADFLLRRSCIGYTPCRGLDAVGRVAQLMGVRLGWSNERVLLEQSEYAGFVGWRDEALPPEQKSLREDQTPPASTRGSA
ncbi:MAG: glycerol-3-phosphate dehydrogenase/oxidase [Thaumarchaeota archaeon]|nr:glycerol-3-phosphate dehydrogenase/oxidase [Nitrososphaerota archaeon]